VLVSESAIEAEVALVSTALPEPLALLAW